MRLSPKQCSASPFESSALKTVGSLVIAEQMLEPVHGEFQNAEEISHNGTTGSNSQLVDYAASWKHCTTQSHMRRSRS